MICICQIVEFTHLIPKTRYSVFVMWYVLNEDTLYEQPSISAELETAKCNADCRGTLQNAFGCWIHICCNAVSLEN